MKRKYVHDCSLVYFCDFCDFYIPIVFLVIDLIVLII